MLLCCSLHGSGPWPAQAEALRLCARQGAAFLARPAPRELVLPLPKELVAEERRGEHGAAAAPGTPALPADDAAAREEEAQLFQALVALRKVQRLMQSLTCYVI